MRRWRFYEGAATIGQKPTRQMPFSRNFKKLAVLYAPMKDLDFFLGARKTTGENNKRCSGRVFNSKSDCFAARDAFSPFWRLKLGPSYVHRDSNENLKQTSPNRKHSNTKDHLLFCLFGVRQTVKASFTRAILLVDAAIKIGLPNRYKRQPDLYF